MASNNTQIAAAGDVKIGSVAQYMSEQFNTTEAQQGQKDLSNMFVEVQEKLGGKNLFDVMSADDFTAEDALDFLPDSLIKKAVESGASEEEVKAGMLEMITKFQGVFATLQSGSQDAAGETDPFQGIKRVQTMLGDEDIDTMKFNPVEQLMQMIKGESAEGDKDVNQLMEMFKPLGLGELAEGDNTADLKQLLQSLPLVVKSSSVKIPIRDSELAEERFAEYRTHVDAFIKAVDNADATPATFGGLIATLQACPLFFEARLEDTQKDVLPIVDKIQEVLAEMIRINTARNYPTVGPILATLLPREAIAAMREDLLDSKTLTEKWNEIETAIDGLIEKHEEAEAEAEEQAAQELADSLD